jgi:hypothetical protein
MFEISRTGSKSMNERIKLLAEQAGAIKCHGYIPHPELDGHLIWAADAALDTKKMDAAKFAELIVRECSGIVQNYMSRWSEDCDLVIKIKEHFGVEE